jgi:ABC-type Na+ efflux pump permease subunit/uncharacterized membrane protein SpoIIM required for sporulation
MKSSVIGTLVRREARDSLSDWRILLPMVVLTLFLPVVVRAAAVYAIGFVDDPLLGPKLMPFAMLLVGFVPASFSLIPALETWVGEKERNTLEALLSAPVGDRALYLGKFLAALTPTLMSSMLAMGTFMFSVLTSRNPLVRGTLQGATPLLIMLLVAIKAASMTAGAVAISSRASSIRSASLLASCIVIPMSVVVQIEAFLFIASPPKIWAVALIGLVLFLTLCLVLWWGTIAFSREEVLSREQRSLRPARDDAPPPRPARAPRTLYATIVGREARDVLADWRMLTPIVLLTLILPLLILGASLYAQTTTAGAQVAQLVPFIQLLVGFLPASFSLITALEAFVGEKERGSLESLFSMPLDDHQLYLGKLLAAFILPLFSGLLAMVIYTLGLLAFGPAVMTAHVTPLRVAQMAAMVIVAALTMVTGAVVISSHTSSVRVANLLASFILLPMSIIIQLIAFFVIATRWDVIGVIGLMLLTVGGLLLNSGIHSFNREEILSREHEQLNLRAVGQNFKAFFREYAPVTLAPELRKRPLSISRFYRQELPQMLRELRWSLLVVLIGVVASIIFGLLFDNAHQTRIMRAIVPTGGIGTAPHSSLGIAVVVFFGNVWRIILTGLFSALTFGVAAFLVPLFAFAAVAHGATWAAAHGKALGALGFLLAYVLPHGIVELPAAILAAAAGLRIGVAGATTPPGVSVGRHMLWALALYFKLLLFVIMPMLLLAALLEGIITPLVAAAVYH